MTLKTDRRTQPRKRPLSLVYVELPPSNGGMMRDLSEHGFSLRAMMPLRQSEKVPFSFALDAAARIDGEAIVFRVDDDGHVAALEFAGLPAHNRDQIRRWLDRFDEPISQEPAPSHPAASKHVSLTELRTMIRVAKPPSAAPPTSESVPPPPPPKVTTASAPELPPVLRSPTAETSPSLTKVAVPPEPQRPPALRAHSVEGTPAPAMSATLPETVPASVSPVVQGPPPPQKPATPTISEPPPPPVAEPPQPPSPMGMALPHPAPPPALNAPPPPAPAIQQVFEQMKTPPLPPLLKLSSVRPEPLPAEIPAEPSVPVENPKPAVELPARSSESLPKIEIPGAKEARIPEPHSVPAVPPRRLPPPPLEPLSSFESETDSDAPGWMDRFTLGRAIGIMLFLTLLAGAYVYHRELGQALIWLGHQIEGDESPESSKIPRPESPAAPHANPDPAASARVVVPPSPGVQQSTAVAEPKSANLPATYDKTPPPKLKDTNPGSLVPLTQTARPLLTPPSVDSSSEPGQEEYLRALQILRSPSKASEVPAAIQLLWVAVEKGNLNAEIDLAELFRTGRGVVKNCDQSRILLAAAAHKGSAEARKRLEALRREGCTN